ncbi:hypothetical protein IFR05_006483 [Cadophora sp. M221]|nr:hypothetical protein IFR05_006483 [Cadophora sp. M221]
MASSQLLDPIPDDGSIADTAERARQLLLSCREIGDEHSRKLAAAQLARFNLWASNIGVFANRHASLDYRLRTAPVVKATIEGNLEIVSLKGTIELSEEELDGFSGIPQSQTLKFGLELLRKSAPDEQVRVQELNLVEDTIGTLHQLSLAIRRASNRNSLARIPKLFDFDDGYTVVKQRKEEHAGDYGIPTQPVRFDVGSAFEEFVRKVLAARWFRPDIEAEVDCEQKEYRQALLDRCVETIATRRRQLAYFRMHQLKLAQENAARSASTRQNNANLESGQPWKQMDGKKIVSVARRGGGPDHPVRYESMNATLSDTVGSEIQPGSIRMVPSSSAPSSTASSTGGGGFGSGGLWEVPAPPKVEAEENEKPCPYCCLVLPAKTFSLHKKAKRWEKHLLEDLQPYICVFTNCSQRGKSYASFKDWQAHLGQPHYSGWLCPLHSEKIDEELLLFHNLPDFENHLRIYHTDLDPSGANDLIHQASQQAVIPGWCFVCFEELPNVLAFQKHMANHFKTMLLLALPWRDDIGDDKAVASDRPMTTAGSNDAGPNSETDLTSINLFESAEADRRLPEPARSLKATEFASLLSIVPIQDRARNSQTWNTSYVPHPAVYSDTQQSPRIIWKKCLLIIRIIIHLRKKGRQRWTPQQWKRFQDQKLHASGHWLRDQLLDARIECHQRAHCYFVPRSAQEDLINVVSVSQDIRSHKPEISEHAALEHAKTACIHSPRLYAILTFVKRGPDICLLSEEGVTDGDLPFVRKANSLSRFALYRKNGDPIKALEAWKDKHLENFDRYQWWMIAPVFRLNEDLYELDDKAVLPFLPFESHELERKQGGYSEVYPVRIHPAHHEFWESDGLAEDEPLVAVKRLFNSHENEFLKEATILNAVGLKRHPHLIKLLATYKHDGKYHLMFPYANSNLRQYWDDRPLPDFSRETVLWSLRQMTGIANGLLRIHTFKVSYPLSATTGAGSHRIPMGVKLMVERGEELFGRHGDIKPENFLWFEHDFETQIPNGVLKVADFGLGRFHGRNSRSGVNPDTVQTSPTYEPPECKLRLPVSRAYDIWSLGCVFLEFITWLLVGSQEIEDFSEFRGRLEPRTGIDDDNFFTIVNDGNGMHAIVRESVVRWTNRLHAEQKSSQLIHDLLELTMRDLLVVDTTERCKASWLFQQLKVYLDKAENDDVYMLKPVPWQPQKPEIEPLEPSDPCRENP